MSYPDQQQAQYPGYPQPQAPYPPAQPQPAYPPQQYQGPAQPYQAPYPQQQAYAQPPQVPPAPPMPRTTMADYMDQGTPAGLSLQFNAIGDRHTGTVARELDDGDFPPQTEIDGKTPKKFPDGRPMTRMVVPLRVRPDQRHTDGKASLSVQGQMAGALKQAMADVGAGHLHGIPENGAEITVAWVNSIPPRTPGYNPTKVYEVVYKRPAGAAPAPQANGQAAAPEQPPWTPQMADQAGQAAVAQAGTPLAQAMFPQQGQPQWPVPGAPLSAPPQPAPPGENPYNNPQLPGYQVPQAQFQPPAPQQGPPQPQVPGMAGPAQQVAAATQAAQAAGQQQQQQQQVPPAPAQPQMHPYTQALMNQATGTPLTPQDQAALAAGPPQ